jgi:hypothetical protein
MHHRAEDVLAPHQAAVKQGKSRSGHEQYERATGQHPGVVAGDLGGLGGLLQRFDLGLDVYARLRVDE